MENKYQEALNYIGLVISNIRGMRNGKTQLANCFLKLQELIDEHNKLEKALDKDCEELAKNSHCPYYIWTGKDEAYYLHPEEHSRKADKYEIKSYLLEESEKDLKDLISVDEPDGTDYGCKVTYRRFGDNHIEIVKVEYMPPKRELESEKE